VFSRVFGQLYRAPLRLRAGSLRAKVQAPHRGYFTTYVPTVSLPLLAIIFPCVFGWCYSCFQMILLATSVVPAWLPQSDLSNRYHEATTICHVCCSWTGCPNQMWATGIMKQLLFAKSVVLAWLPQSDVSNRYNEDTGEWSSSPRLLSWHGCPNQTWATRTNGQLLYFNEWIVTN
jgi:hypothetical protein